MRILITGASRGLGAVASRAFAEDDHTLFLMGRSNHSLAEVKASCKNPERHTLIVQDFMKMEGFIWPEQEPLDAVIHCAGGGLGMRGAWLNAKGLYELFMTNLGGQAEVNRFVGYQMQERGRGYIVHVCSIASGEAVGSVGYNTMKSALAAYVRSLGREMAPHGVVVTGIAPGGFKSPGNAMDRLATTNPEAYKDFTDKRLPRGFMGKAEELIPLLKMLVTPQASMMGGSVIPIDAGEGVYYG